MAILRVLTENDKKLLQGMLDKQRHEPINSRCRPVPPIDDYLGPEVYVAKTPSGGIPALVSIRPGEAECTVYQLLYSSGQYLLGATSVTRNVYNLGEAAIPGNTWILIARDKFGNWWVTERVTSEDVAEDWCIAITNACTGQLKYQRSTSGAITLTDIPCDDCDDAPSTGTGTGTTSDDPGCGCPEVASYCVQGGFPGIQTECTSLDSLCEQLVGTILLYPTGPACIYQGGIPGGTICGYYNTYLQANLRVTGQTLVIGNAGGVMAGYARSGSWDCQDDILLTKVFPIGSAADTTNQCSNWPETITIRRSCEPGTGTGTDEDETGTGTGGGADIAITGLGTASQAATTTLTKTVTTEAGLLVIDVCALSALQTPNLLSAQFNGVDFSLGGYGAATVAVVGANASISQLALVVPAGTHDIVITVDTSSLILLTVRNVTGLVSNLNDASVQATGNGTTPTTAASSLSTAVDEAALASFVLIAPGGAFTWAGTPTFTDGSQDVTGIVGLLAITLTEGRYISNTIRTFAAALSGITPSGWAGGIGTYK